jgi:hypothetical protein
MDKEDMLRIDQAHRDFALASSRQRSNQQKVVVYMNVVSDAAINGKAELQIFMDAPVRHKAERKAERLPPETQG